jgi:hypothetical protein
MYTLFSGGKHLICKYNFDKPHKNNNVGVAMSADDRNVVDSSRSSTLSTIKINGVTTNAQTSFKKKLKPTQTKYTIAVFASSGNH